jgi:hypothetical protein
METKRMTMAEIDEAIHICASRNCEEAPGCPAKVLETERGGRCLIMHYKPSDKPTTGSWDDHVRMWAAQAHKEIGVDPLYEDLRKVKEADDDKEDV